MLSTRLGMCHPSAQVCIVHADLTSQWVYYYAVALCIYLHSMCDKPNSGGWRKTEFPYTCTSNQRVGARIPRHFDQQCLYCSRFFHNVHVHNYYFLTKNCFIYLILRSLIISSIYLPKYFY